MLIIDCRNIELTKVQKYVKGEKTAGQRNFVQQKLSNVVFKSNTPNTQERDLLKNYSGDFHSIELLKVEVITTYALTSFPCAFFVQKVNPTVSVER